MDLSGPLRRGAFSRPHLLLVVAPTEVQARLAVERYARERGWPVARTAADADVLVVVGRPVAGLGDVVAVLERQIPAPWVRVDVTGPAGVSEALDPLPERLSAWTPTGEDAQRDTAHETAAMTRPGRRGGDAMNGHHDHSVEASDQPHAGHDLAGSGGHGMAEADGHAGHDMAGSGGHAGHDVAGHEGHDDRGGAGPADDLGDGGGHQMGVHDMRSHQMGGHDMGGHDMDGHGHDDMGVVAGLPMAGRAPDRDGLKLDVLHVPFGPVLPHWPAGLRVSLAVQGDVVQEASVRALGIADDGSVPFWDEPALRALAGASVAAGEVARRRAASHLDSLARLLGVAGWDGPAVRCAVLRDRTLAGEPTGPLAAAFRPLVRRVVRSRVLRRMTIGVGEADAATADRAGISGPAAITAGDVWARLVRWVRSVEEDLARLDDRSPAADVEGPRGPLDGPDPPSAVLLDVLPGLLVGAELAAVRLIVASLDPDLAELALRSTVTAGG